jgi:hypothetical protein
MSTKLRWARLQLTGGASLPVRAVRHEGKLFIECDSVAPFLQHLYSDKNTSAMQVSLLASRPLVRGVLIEGEGGLFELVDKGGATSSALPSLSELQASERILQRLLWQVQ